MFSVPQDKIDLIPIMARLVVVVYEVIPQMHEAVEKIELIKTFKEFKRKSLVNRNGYYIVSSDESIKPQRKTNKHNTSKINQNTTKIQS